MNRPDRLREFLGHMTSLADQAHGDEPAMLDRGRALLSGLVSHDDWLPDPWAAPDPERYRQYLLYCDPLERFSVVSFVWGPGQSTPVHDHTVWGLIGVLRGAEVCEAFERSDGGGLRGLGECTLAPGTVDAVSPTIGDIHTVRNAYDDRTSISIHVYGADIGAVRRHVYDPATGAVKDFVSGYSNSVLPNVWGSTG
jgi:predicted metal-dependent enzyme (double-stranded beta helix superfamily)